MKQTLESKRLLLGYIASLGASAAYGASAVLGRKVTTDIAPAMVLTAFALVFGTLMVAALFHRHAATDLIASKPPGRALFWVSMAGLASAFGVGCFFFGLEQAPVVVVAPLVGTSPLFAIALTHIFLQRLETITMRTVAGALLVVVGVALVTIGGQR